jgi:outer membrane protein TolC
MNCLTKWLIVVVVVIPQFTIAQVLTLDEANRLARDNYPAIRQKDMIRQTSDLSVENLQKNFLPQLSLNGQASYQSDVTSVDVPIPGVKIEAPEKDQYKITADLSQTIYDGRLTHHQKTLQQLNAKSDDQAVEVELYKLRDRISQIYLGVLFTDEQIKQVELVKVDLQTGLKRVQAQLNNGMAYRSNVSTIEAELLKLDQRRIELLASRTALLQTLSLFINRPLDSSIVLQTPAPAASADTLITRPELQLFSFQSQALAQQNRLITSRNLPRTSLFVQGGYGRPGLNMLKNEFDLFYITGIRFNWSLAGLYTAKNDRKIVKLNQDMVGIKRDVFLLNTRADITRQVNEINKLTQLIESDKQIIALRNSVTKASNAQLENGVITSSDYLREVNAEDQARQALITHQLQLLQAQIALDILKGK